MHSKPVTDYPKSVTVKLFGNPWELGDTVFDKHCPGNAAALMSSLQFKAEWKTGLKYAARFQNDRKTSQEGRNGALPFLMGLRARHFLRRSTTN